MLVSYSETEIEEYEAVSKSKSRTCDVASDHSGVVADTAAVDCCSPGTRKHSWLASCVVLHSV